MLLFMKAVMASAIMEFGASYSMHKWLLWVCQCSKSTALDHVVKRAMLHLIACIVCI